MIVSSVSNDTRLIGIVGGLSSKDKRTTEMRKLINFGQKAFKRSLIFKNSEVIDKADVWGGNQSSVNLTIPKDISLLLDIRGRRFLNARYSFKEPIFAPIKKGDSIGKIVILNDNDIIVEANLISNEDIGVNNIVGKAIGAARYLIN